MNNKEQTNEPVRVFRAPGMSVAIFENTSDDRTFYKLTAQRIYKSGKEFKTSHSFAVSELPTLILLLVRAWAHAADLEEKSGNRSDD